MPRAGVCSERVALSFARRPGCAPLCPNSHTATEKASVCPLSRRQVKSISFQLGSYRKRLNVESAREVKVDRSLITDLPRHKYVERCKQRAFDYLDRGDLKNAVASFVSNMSARPDCELPDHLAALGVLLLTGNDVLGWRTLIEGIR